MNKDFNWALFGLIISQMSWGFSCKCAHTTTPLLSQKELHMNFSHVKDWLLLLLFSILIHTWCSCYCYYFTFFFTPYFFEIENIIKITSRLSHSIHWICSNINIIIIKVYKSTIVCFIILYTHRTKKNKIFYYRCLTWFGNTFGYDSIFFDDWETAIRKRII